MSTESEHAHTNRLVGETSPYLLQHAHNPVDWYPWGPEALERAREENRPILLSIGYASCHWCHVMERESFEDEAIAALMNEHFVCIKVDREERPDLDDIYMQATLALNGGQGGWPMTVFLTPAQEPFFAGTYYPPTDRYGRPGFPTVLRRLAEAWDREQEVVVEQAAVLTERIRDAATPGLARGVGAAEIEAAVEQLAADYDARHGGFGGAPKFPPTGALALLLRHHQRTGDERTLSMVEGTLNAMARGGIYDHIGGGFARYSTDERWLVPHFEKMLYDNAQLVRIYVEAWQVTGKGDYERVARDVLDYVLREMTAPEGGFYSATDADSEGVEGKFFVWTPEEIAAAAGSGDDAEDDAELFCDFYDIEEGGNWEGRSIPNTPRPLAHVAARHRLEPQEAARRIERVRWRVYEARAARVPPGLDDKILTAWNALMIGALAEASRAFGEPRYLTAAQRAADFLWSTLRAEDGRLLRTYRAGRAHLAGVPEDHAYLCDALVDLYEAGGRPEDLARARELGERLTSEFHAGEGAFFSTARDHERLIVRRRDGQDGAVPNPNAVAASALMRLGRHLRRDEWTHVAGEAIEAFGALIGRHGRAFARSLIVVDALLEEPVEVALVGEPGAADTEALRKELGRQFLPNRLIAAGPPGAEGHSALLAGKHIVAGRAALYVCRDFVCQAPVTDPAGVGAALAGHREGSVRRALVGGVRSGAATPEGTAALAQRFAQRHGGHGYRELGRTALHCSRLGFGAYRVDDADPAHADALGAALAAGVNLIDTSTNYTGGGSERAVGDVLRSVIAEGELRREEVIVVSKIGYVQGPNLALVRERMTSERPFREVVRYADDCWHCIHPDFLDDQLGRSLTRLQIETLDVCLLHNPEYYFSDAAQRGERDLDALRETFDARLEAAFAYFETQVAAGRIRWYGVSSNNLAAPPDDPEATSLERMLAAARRAGGDQHHFAVVQLPFNLLEGRALIARDASGETLLERARAAGLGVLVNRPLNAFHRRALVRLVDYDVDASAGDAEEVTRRLVAVERLEAELKSRLTVQVRGPKGQTMPIGRLLSWADELRGLRNEVGDAAHWESLEHQAIRPQLAMVLRVLTTLPPEMAGHWARLRGPYLEALEALFAAFRAEAARKSQARSDRIAVAIDPHLPKERRPEPLSRKALWLVDGAGPSCVLNGMRERAWVEDSVAIMGWPPHGDPRAAFEAASGAVEAERDGE